MKKSLCVLLALGFGSYLLADTKLDTKVISTNGFETSLADTSYNLLVLEGDEMRERGYKDIKEALSSLPNVSVVGTGIGYSVDVRGQGEKANKTVKVYLDGMLLNAEDNAHMHTPFESINIEDVEQIEVIPGGGSVVYGDGAVGGVINIITKSSLSKEYANAYFKIGSFSHKSFGGGLGHKLNDKLYANINFNIIDEKGYQWADINESVNANFGLRYTPDDSQSLALNVGLMQNDTRGSNPLTQEQIKQNRRSDGDALKEEVKSSKTRNINLKYHNNINDNISFQAMPYYNEFYLNDDNFSDEKKGIKLSAKFAYGMSSTNIGYEYLQNKGKRDSFAKADVKKQSHSIYVLENLNIDDIFNIDIGGRYEKADYDFARKMGTSSFAGDKTNDDFGLNLVLGANIADDSKVYAKVEKGYTLPSAYDLTDKKDGTNYTIANTKAESYMSYELGYKGLIAEQYVGLTAFYTVTKDEIFKDMKSERLAEAPFYKVSWEHQNLGKTERYGIELALNQNLLDGDLELYENFSYLSAKVKQDALHPKRVGEKMPSVSPFKANIGGSYLVLNSLKLRASYDYFSKTKWVFEDTLGKTVDKSLNNKDAYGVLNLGMTYLPTKNLSLSFDAKNILGEKYNVRCWKDGTCNPAPKQSFYAEFRYKY